VNERDDIPNNRIIQGYAPRLPGWEDAGIALEHSEITPR
jgi:hypothetical protein